MIESPTKPQHHKDTKTLIDALLAEQQSLTAVDRSSRWHESVNPAAHGISYQHLIPLTKPDKGEQYGFEVDLDRCSGCKACVTACHSLNGLDEDEAWRETGLLLGEDWRQPYQQTVTTACHHCVDPGCLNGCPVLAYEKDPVTGIVRHLDDQCIGCQYCILKCPYEVPKYSVKRGIVRKCDMCSQRLAVGEAPACAQACPNEAIRISIVNQEDQATQFRGDRKRRASSDALRTIPTPLFLPVSPLPSITVPTTRYVSGRPFPQAITSADAGTTKPQPAHVPLIAMLVLTQMSVGISLMFPLMHNRLGSPVIMAAMSSVLLLAGLVASVFHLGRPLKAWRAFLGLKTSWLSREIVAFSGLVPLALSTLVLTCFHTPWASALRVPVACLTAGIGVLSVACSSMIYQDTKRVSWKGWRTFSKFFGTTALLGTGCAWVLGTLEGRAEWFLGAMLATFQLLKFAAEHLANLPMERDGEPTSEMNKVGSPAWQLERSERLMTGRLGGWSRSRMALGWLGGVALPLFCLVNPAASPITSLAALTLIVAGECVERSLFFRTVTTFKMPGNL